MIIDHLRRSQAPVSDEAWAQIEAEATRTLKSSLAGRRLVDVDGPHGWQHSAYSRGQVTRPDHPPHEGVVAKVRQVQPLVELRTPFEVSFDALDAADRGAPDADWQPVVEAAQRAALAEDTSIFYGYVAGGMAGIVPSSVHEPVLLGEDYDQYPSYVARAVSRLRVAGVEGPYALALGPRCYTGVVETTEHGGYPVFEHLKMILGGPVLWAPGVDGAVVVSQRGGDYALILGQDMSIGYRAHSPAGVQLYLEESLTLVVIDDRAAVGLVYPS